MRVAVLLLVLCASSTAMAADRDARWGQIQGLMAGIALAHAIQPIAAGVGDIEWKDKYYVSIGGGVLYGTAFVGLMVRQKWALWIALIGPAVGLSSVLTGWALDEAGVIDAEIRPDAFQIGGGVLQVAAWLVAFDLVKHGDTEVTVHPMRGGGVIAISGRF